MSSKRAGDIATIDAVLSAPQIPLDVSSGGSSPIDTVISPVPGTPTVVPDNDDLSDIKEKREEDELSAEQQALTSQQREEAQLQQMQARQANLLQRGLGSAWSAANSVKNGIGSIAMPGGLATPVITLLILFFLIVQANGKTRASWLWLALTNNAFVDTSSADSSSGSDSSGSGADSSGSGSSIPSGTFETPGSGAGGLGGGSSGNFGTSTSAFVNMQQEFV